MSCSFPVNCHLSIKNLLRTDQIHFAFTARTINWLHSPLHFFPHKERFHHVEKINSKWDSKKRVTEPHSGLLLEGWTVPFLVCIFYIHGSGSTHTWESQILGKGGEGDCDLHISQEYNKANLGHEQAALASGGLHLPLPGS